MRIMTMAIVRICVLHLNSFYSPSTCGKYDAEQTTPRVSGLRQHLFYALSYVGCMILSSAPRSIAARQGHL